MLTVEFLGKSARDYTRRSDGAQKVAHNVSVLTDEGEAGNLFVTEPVFASLNGVKRGDRLEVLPYVSVWQGSAELRVFELRVIKAA